VTVSPFDVLACPHCAASPLTQSPGNWTCAACGSQFPLLDGIPWLFADPGASLGEWRERLHRLVVELEAQAAGIRAELDAKDLAANTRTRLKLLAQAYADHARRLHALLAPLALDVKLATRETHLALRTRLPASQDLASYYVNLHRDWAWGAEENEASFELVKQAKGERPLGTMLVLGAGGCRLAYDLHQRCAPQATCALDVNPLLLFAARRILAGQPVALYEFPIAPRAIEFHAVLRELRAETPVRDGFQLVFGDALRAPIRAGSVDTVLTPWFIDIVPADFAELAARINRLLRPGGRWLNFGSLSFAQRAAARCYSLDEVVEIVAGNGFGRPTAREAIVPYMKSPASRHSRLEGVVVFSADKEREVPEPPEFSALPEWLVRDDLPVPLLQEMQVTAVATRIQAFVMSLVDGRRSLQDMAQVLVDQRLMEGHEAAPAVRGFLVRMYEDSRTRTQF
jgi:uncharacterized protein YbaR (Trm112 family)/SAM-dependent methyltransferase